MNSEEIRKYLIEKEYEPSEELGHEMRLDFKRLKENKASSD